MTRCPSCGIRPNQPRYFRAHAKRYRFVRVIDSRLVRRFRIPLRRWRCPNCQSSFTEYPQFLVAHKQYTLRELHLRAKLYVEKEGVTYRRGVSEAGLPIFHDESLTSAAPALPEDISETTPVLSHTTLYRWVTAFGNASSRTNAGQAEKISPRKYRSDARKRALGSCLALFGRPMVHDCTTSDAPPPSSQQV